MSTGCLVRLFCVLPLAIGQAVVANAQVASKPFAEIRVIFAPERIVCKGGSYEQKTCPPGMSPPEFERLKILSTRNDFFRVGSGRTAFKFKSENYFESRRDARFNSKYSAVVEFAWKDTRPKSFTVQKRNGDGDTLGDDYMTSIGSDRTYYHFSNSFIYQMIMSIQTKSPDVVIVLSGH